MGPQPPSPTFRSGKGQAEQGRLVPQEQAGLRPLGSSSYFASNGSPGFASVAMGSPRSPSTDGTGVVPTAMSGRSRWGWKCPRGHSVQLPVVAVCVCVGGYSGREDRGRQLSQAPVLTRPPPMGVTPAPCPLELFPLRTKPARGASAPFDSPAKTW